MTIDDARKEVGERLGLVGFDGSASGYSNLSAQDQERVSVATTAYVLQNPERFTKEQAEVSRIAAGKANFGALGDYSMGSYLDSAVEFLKAYGETAGNVIVGAAGIAGKSAKALGIDLGFLVGLVAVAALVYFGAPYVLPRLKAASSKSKVAA